MEQLLDYIMKEEIKATSKCGAYAGLFPLEVYNASLPLFNLFIGLLQVQFLAGATGFSIQQYTELPWNGFDSLLTPCCGEPLGVIHLVWVKKTKGGPMNHVIPIPPSTCELRLCLL